MTEEMVQPKASEGLNPENIDISDYITASHHIDLLHKNYAAIGHRSDFISVAATQKAADHMGIPLERLRVRFEFKTTKDGKVKRKNALDMGPWENPVTIANDEEPDGADVNNYVSVLEVSATADTATGAPAQTIMPSGGQASVRTDGGGGGDMSWLWWVLGIAAVGIFAAIVWRYFIAGKVIGGVQMPGPFIKGKMGQAPGAAAVTPAAPAPAPVVVVK